MALAERAWSLAVPHHARGARVARHRLAAELSGVLRAPILADLLTVVTEMVGNAVIHAEPLPGGVVRVAWRLRPGVGSETVEVRVTDGGATEEPSVKALDPDAVAGRGLTIVAALADRWGVHRDGLGQSVWAELTATTPADHGLVPTV
jgi:anti-sigma regulatory factor (Ser/Thr protein kinase)